MIRTIGLAALAALLAADASAQAIPAADVKIQSVNAVVDHSGFSCTVQVHNDNDDDAQHVKVVLILPLEVQVVAASKKCVAGPEYPAIGFVRCSLGSMAVGQVKSVTIKTTAPPRNRTCSAFVQNDVPDPNPSNNFGQSTAP